MQSVAVDDANPQAGEEAYILQLSLPSASGDTTGALMDKIGRFVELYLAAAQPGHARFAQMGGTTWVIAAPGEDAFALNQARADLATTLYGHDDGVQVQLEWPDGVEPVDPDAVESNPDPVAVVEVSESKADDSFDVGDDAWTLGDAAAAEPQVPAEINDAHLGVEPDLDDEAWSVGATVAEEEAPAQAEDVFVIDDLGEGSADEMAEEVVSEGSVSEAAEAVSHADPVEDEGPGYTFEIATAAQRAAFDDSTDVFEVDVFDIEIVDGDENDAGLQPSAPTIQTADEVPIEPEITDLEILETLTEVPDRPQTPDIAKELSAFRAEMRQIAASIPGASSGDVMAEFRTELEAISGAMGQRVDGAAQRIEAAASQIVEASARVDADRLSHAASRAEDSARQLETGVADALNALNAAMKAMSGHEPAPASGAAG